MEYGLKDKVVAITGGTTGIGRAVAEGFLREGAKVAVCSHNPGKVEKAQKYFDSLGYQVLTSQTDVTSNAELRAFADMVVSYYGRIDVWINHAGINIRGGFEQLPEEDFQRTMNCNVKAVFYGTAYAAAYMRKTGGGVIIDTSSFTAVLPTAGVAVYSASNAAVSSLVATTAAELAADNIRVVGVIPGMVVTPQTEAIVSAGTEKLLKSIPMQRLAVPEDMVGTYLFLASNQAAYINGVCIRVDGGKYCTQNPLWSWENKKL